MTETLDDMYRGVRRQLLRSDVDNKQGALLTVLGMLIT